jgi:hypothetical protein
MRAVGGGGVRGRNSESLLTREKQNFSSTSLQMISCDTRQQYSAVSGVPNSVYLQQSILGICGVSINERSTMRGILLLVNPNVHHHESPPSLQSSLNQLKPQSQRWKQLKNRRSSSPSAAWLVIWTPFTSPQHIPVTCCVTIFVYMSCFTHVNCIRHLIVLFGLITVRCRDCPVSKVGTAEPPGIDSKQDCFPF